MIQALRDAGHEVFRVKEHIPVESGDEVVIAKAQELDSIFIVAQWRLCRHRGLSAFPVQRDHRNSNPEPSPAYGDADEAVDSLLGFTPFGGPLQRQVVSDGSGSNQDSRLNCAILRFAASGDRPGGGLMAAEGQDEPTARKPCKLPSASSGLAGQVVRDGSNKISVATSRALYSRGTSQRSGAVFETP